MSHIKIGKNSTFESLKEAKKFARLRASWRIHMYVERIGSSFRASNIEPGDLTLLIAEYKISVDCLGPRAHVRIREWDYGRRGKWGRL